MWRRLTETEFQHRSQGAIDDQISHRNIQHIQLAIRAIREVFQRKRERQGQSKTQTRMAEDPSTISDFTYQDWYESRFQTMLWQTGKLAIFVSCVLRPKGKPKIPEVIPV
jgi:predicted NACHT family NTPase